MSFDLSLLTAIPFVIMLLMIAVAPLVCNHWWEKNSNKSIVVFALVIPTIFYLLANDMRSELEHQLFGDYVPFIILLTALFVITGGIHLSGDIEAKPWVNTLFLAAGYIMASFMGTTGAAMLLIRALLATNEQRSYKVHTVLFFIAAVANCGGLLTPLGDPPLLLLYLRGAPFGWFLQLLPIWLCTGVLLLTAYFLLDSYYYRKEPWQNRSSDRREKKPFRIGGKINFIYLFGAVASVAFINGDYIPAMGDVNASFIIRFLREFVLIGLTLLSWFTTKQKVRELNRYSWQPIMEVGILFLGIFITMTPALMILSKYAPELGLSMPWQFYYATGSLSGFLDNAPTAVAFYSVALQLPTEGVVVAGISEVLLEVIAVSSVYFGALTYIGNGPNFMVKAIAEESGVTMPSFFGYIFKFSLLVLLPIYVIIQLIFF